MSAGAGTLARIPVWGRVYGAVNRAFAGQPDAVLTMLLLLGAMGLLWAVFYAPPAMKAAILAYIIIP